MARKRIAFLAAALLAVGMVAVAAPAFADHESSDEDGPSDASHFGRCTAYENNENGRENGNAGDAPPFQDLEEDAEEHDQSVEEFCNEVDHPSEGNPGNGR